MSLDVCVEGYAQTVEYYGTDEIQGVQCAPLEDSPPEATIVNTSVPDYLVDEMFEPGVFWFQTGPPTSLDDETGQTRGDTWLPEYLDPDDQLDPSDVDWQNPTTQLDATCASPYIGAVATSQSVSQTTHVFTLPTANVGDAYLALISSAQEVGAAMAFPSGWQVALNILTTVNSPNDNNGVVLYRIVDGTEGASITVTTALTETLGAIIYRISNADPGSGVVATGYPTQFADAPSIDSPWGTSPALYVTAQFVAGVDAPTTFPANMPAGRVTANGRLAAAAAQSSAGSFNPGAFSNPATDSWVATVVVKGYCLDSLNAEPAYTSIPVELEPEAEVDCFGTQSQGPNDDPNIVFDDPDTGKGYQPDWLEPQAEPNPDDVTFGWQRQSFIEDEHGPAGWWTAVTEAPENVFDYSTDWWIQTPTFTDDPLDVDDETTISTYQPDWLEPEAELDANDLDWSAEPKRDVEICVYPDAESLKFSGHLLGSSAPLDYPAGMSVGEMLIAVIFTENVGSPFTWPSGWVEVSDEPNGAGDVGVAYRIVTGTEGSSFNVTLSAVTPAVGFVARVPGADTSTAPEASSLSTTPNPPSLTASWGADKTLFLAVYGQVSPTVFPTPPDANRTAREVAFNPNPFGSQLLLSVIGHQVNSNTYDFATFTDIGTPGSDVSQVIAIRGYCLFDPPVSMEAPDYLNDPAEDEPTPEGWVQWPYDNEPGQSFDIVNTCVPDTMVPEDEVDSEGWRCAPLQDTPTEDGINRVEVQPFLSVDNDEESYAGFQASPLHDFPDNADINSRAVPDDLEPEAGVDTNGWFSAPLHETPSTTDITDTSVPAALDPDDQVDSNGWAFRLPDMEAAPVVVEPTPDLGTSVGTLPGHLGKRPRWWLEDVAKKEKAKRARGEGVWPNLPEPKQAPPWNPKTLTAKSARPRLSQINRDWKIKMRKVRQADDALIAAIIAALLTEKPDGKPD